MNILKRLFSRKSVSIGPVEEQAVLIHLDGSGLPDGVYDEYDVVTLEDQIQGALVGTGLGEYDGDEFGPGETTLFLYGPDAERLFTWIEPILKKYPLCRNARVVIRKGGVGALQREIRLPTT